MSNGRRETPASKGRLKGTYTFTLSDVAIARVRFLAKQQGVSSSRVLEALIGEVDYRDMFDRFDRRVPMAQIVIATGQPPALVRALYDEYKRDLYEDEPPPVRALPSPAPAPPAPAPAPAVRLLPTPPARARRP